MSERRRPGNFEAFSLSSALSSFRAPTQGVGNALVRDSARTRKSARPVSGNGSPPAVHISKGEIIMVTFFSGMLSGMLAMLLVISLCSAGRE
jgi:hypothetical protein